MAPPRIPLGDRRGGVPRQLFPAPCSTLLYSAEGELLGARIAPDGQWRFPAADSLPDKFVDCLLTYEDKRFFYHPGIDPAAIFRAIRLNGKAGRVVSGGSTLTMQLARIARGNQDRTFYEKTIEMCWALFLETTYSKQEILNLYASHAPFGGKRDRAGDRRMALFRAKRLRAIVGRERHARGSS